MQTNCVCHPNIFRLCLSLSADIQYKNWYSNPLSAKAFHYSKHPEECARNFWLLQLPECILFRHFLQKTDRDVATAVPQKVRKHHVFIFPGIGTTLWRNPEAYSPNSFADTGTPIPNRLKTSNHCNTNPQSHPSPFIASDYSSISALKTAPNQHW